MVNAVRTVQIVEAKAKFSSLLAAVELGESIAITRHGRIVARIVPDKPCMATVLFAPMWEDRDELDLVAPVDEPPETVESP